MKINLKDIKSLYLNYQIPLTLGISTMFFVLACFWTPFMVFAWVVLGATFIFSNIHNILCYVIYFMMFSRNTIFFVGVGIIAFIAILTKYIIDLVKKRVKTYIIPLIFTTIFCIFFIPITFAHLDMFHMYHTEFQGIVQGLLFIGILYVIYLLFCYKEQIKLSECFNFLFYGIIASGVVCLILFFTESAKIAFYDVNGFIYKPVKDLIFLVDEGTNRLMLLSYHANHLASYCMYIMTYAAYYLMNNKFSDDKKSYYYNAVMLVISTIIGILTMSKAFLITTALIFLYLAVFFVIKFKKKSLYVIIPASIIFIVGVIVFWGVFEKIINRFFVYEKGESFFGILTTGRSVIWSQYINDLLSSPWKLLFGKGLFQVEIITIGPHNMLLEIMYRVGIIGVILLGVLCYLYARETNGNLKFSFKRLLPLLIFLVHSIQEANFDERFLFLIFAIMLLYEQKNDKKVVVENEKQNEIDNLEPKTKQENIIVDEK